jgi:hypothetical protein
MKLLIPVCNLLLFVAGNLLHAQSLTVMFGWPMDHAAVPALTCISGKVSSPSAQVVAAVRPMESGDVWIQKSITVSADGHYVGLIHAGEKSIPEHNGKWLEIRVFANPRGRKLQEGDRLGEWPDAEAASDVVRVQRQDGAPDGCGASLIVPLNEGGHVNLSPIDPPTAGAGFVGSRSKWRWIAAEVVFVLVLVALVVMPERAKRGMHTLTVWLQTVRDWLVGIARFCADTVLRFGRWLLNCVSTTVPLLWSARGQRGDLRQMALEALLIGPLAFATTAAFYAEGMMIWKGLVVLLGGDDGGGNSTTGVLSDLLPGAAAIAKAVTTSGAHGVSWWAVLSRFPEHLVKLFAKLWEEQFGFLAIGLAGLQGAFGIVLLWGMGTERPLRLRLVALFRERPLLTMLFGMLNIALAILAGNRGSELTLHGNWQLVTIISVLLALTMSWILALSTHYWFECVAACLGTGKSIALIGALSVGAFGLFCVATGMGLAVLVVVGAAFLAFVAFIIAAWCFLQFAELMGELVRRLRWLALVPAALERPAGVVTAALMALAVLVSRLKSYRFWMVLLLAGALMTQPVAAQSAPLHGYQAWAICIDRSLSPDKEQFQKLLGILVAIVEQEVSYEDAVWLIEIGGDRRPVTVFRMPGRRTRRSDPVDAEGRLRVDKTRLEEAIGGMSQVAASTNLQIPLEAALGILHSQTGASRRTLILGSDFLTDTGRDRVSAAPPAAPAGNAAAAVDALLLVMYPKPRYLELIGGTPVALFHKIEASWSNYLTGQQSGSVRVRLVDSVALDSRGGGRPGKTTRPNTGGD